MDSSSSSSPLKGKAMRATQMFNGRDSMGREIDVAQSVSGAWYNRVYINKGSYGWGWSKWATLEKAPTFATRVLNQCEYAGAPEYVEIEPGSRIEWGFSTLARVAGAERLRLPA